MSKAGQNGEDMRLSDNKEERENSIINNGQKNRVKSVIIGLEDVADQRIYIFKDAVN